MTPETYCPRCAAPVRLTARYCGHCRAELRPVRGGARRRSVALPVLIGLLVALLGLGGVGAYARVRAVVSAPSPRLAQAPAAAPDVGSTAPISTVTPQPAPPPTPVPTPAEAVLAVVQAHWDAIRDHRFEEAYAYLGPSLATGESNWVGSHRRDGITDIRYEFRVRDVSGDVATVDVVTLRTTAQSSQAGDNPSGCLSWSGSYGLVRQGGRWLIDQVHLSSTPC